MSNTWDYEITKEECKLLCKVIDKCRIKTSLNKESIIDELRYAVSDDNGNAQLYPREWEYVYQAVDNKLNGTRIQQRDVLQGLYEGLTVLRKKHE